MPNRYVTTAEAARWTGRDIKLIGRWVRSGEIKAVAKDGRSNLVDLASAIEAHLSHPQHGRRLKHVEFTLPDGTVVTRTVAVPRKEG